jgi:hypothetical protein
MQDGFYNIEYTRWWSNQGFTLFFKPGMDYNEQMVFLFRERLKEKSCNFVDYSCYKEKDGKIIDNMNEVAIEGKVEIQQTWTNFENPTWLDLAVEANKLVIADRCHCYFEGFKIERVVEDTTIISLSMGS